MRKKMNKNTLLKVAFALVLLTITLSTATSMYRSSKQYEQVKECIDNGSTPKECDILIYGEPKKMIGGLN